MSYMELAAGLVKRLEGCKLTGYPDPGGKPTIGYGHTGPEVQVGQTISQETADAYLNVDLGIAENRLRGVLDPLSRSSLADHEHAALIAFVFNLGAQPGWTIWKDINDNKLADVPAQMRRFDHGMVGGKLVEIPGLKARREAEISFWSTADVPDALAAASQAGPPSSYVVPLPTPPVPAPIPPLSKTSVASKVVTCVAGCAAATGSFGSQVHDIVAPHASESHWFQTLAIGASGLVVAAGIVGLLVHASQAQARAN